MSISNVQGPENMRRCSTPRLPAVGIGEYLAGEIGSAVGATPLPSAGLMAELETSMGPLPVIWNFTTWLSCGTVSEVVAVL